MNTRGRRITQLVTLSIDYLISQLLGKLTTDVFCNSFIKREKVCCVHDVYSQHISASNSCPVFPCNLERDIHFVVIDY